MWWAPVIRLLVSLSPHCPPHMVSVRHRGDRSEESSQWKTGPLELARLMSRGKLTQELIMAKLACSNPLGLETPLNLNLHLQTDKEKACPCRCLRCFYLKMHYVRCEYWKVSSISAFRCTQCLRLFCGLCWHRCKVNMNYSGKIGFSQPSHIPCGWCSV